MKVQSYNIGYGPKLISFNDSADTEFALRAFPLGIMIFLSLSFFLAVTFNYFHLYFLNKSCLWKISNRDVCLCEFISAANIISLTAVTWYGMAWRSILTSIDLFIHIDWPIHLFTHLFIWTFYHDIWNSLGGYVAFPANVEVDDVTGEITKELEDPDLLQNRPPFQRALVISGIHPFIHPSLS